MSVVLIELRGPLIKLYNEELIVITLIFCVYVATFHLKISVLTIMYYAIVLMKFE